MVAGRPSGRPLDLIAFNLVFRYGNNKKELDNHILAIYNVHETYKSPKCDSIHIIRRFMCNNYVFEVTR